jgi:dTDP-4-dehydrorhamnose reductase
MATRWIVAGDKGQLGRALVRVLMASPGRELVAAVDLPELDIADAEAVEALVAANPADFVVNAAAFTQVDRCESERDAAHRSNAVGPGVLARSCARVGSRLVHVSTDYVFAGDSERPYREEDTPAPVSVYGKTKREGEERVRNEAPDALIVRTSWVFGEGRNFIAAILAQGAARRDGSQSGPLAVVDDQRGCPTYAEDLAAAIVSLLEGGASGLYHVCNAGIATWWDLARLSLDLGGYADLSIDRLRTEDLVLAAPRPRSSVLDCSKAEKAGVERRSWQEAVREYLEADFSPMVGQRGTG